MPGFTAKEHEIVKALIETKAVDFAALGQVFAEHGASASMTLSGEDFFCGTVRRFIRAFKLNDVGNPVEQLSALQQLKSEVQG
jgi:hypothetical protein